MIDAALQDLATRYVLRDLSDDEAAQFRSDLARDPELQRFVADLHEAIAELALSTPPKSPPPEVLAQILAKIRGGGA